MAGDPFARMTNRLAARLGSEAVFRGGPIKAALELNVEVYGENNSVTRRTVVTLFGVLDPLSGEVVQIGADSYRLDGLLEDDGYSANWTVIKL